jgi:valyl-tRNA synthetase
MLDKHFDFASSEPDLYDQWEKSGAFAPKDGGEGFSIVIPPPNVTGSLHIGHALNNTLQDILARFERMRGRSVLWLPGTDHAGIATQMVVERQLAEQQIKRRDLGREEFLAKVWEWKAQSGGTIVKQLRRLGASCDWSRERFTMDEGLSRAVLKVFVDLYRDGLIYRDKRLVNWDPHFQTAISDLEVESIEVNGHYWHLAYELADGLSYQHHIVDENGITQFENRTFIVVATTRPETMLGDVAVAVHPDDERYQTLIGGFVILPITGRKIPIIADDYADPTKGSGVVKITPAHDFNDFLVGKRHNLEMISIFDESACLNHLVPMGFEGLDRFEARKQIIARAEEEGWLKAIEQTRHLVPHGDRSGVVIEPFLTDQWYVNAGALAVEAIKAVEDGRTIFEPKHWEKTYFEWMRNIEPWCISRQLWWGHRIPAWFGPDGHIFVAETELKAQEDANSHYGHPVDLQQDEDVLDTWFSSALWPFSTMGWPDETEDLKRFYPTNTLVTGFDIIFFWVARMMMMGLKFTQKVPFDRIFINALVRDEKGQKMSKSKGNVIDPLALIDELGADPLRFTLSAMSGQGRDIKLSKARIEGYRNFGTKLWNAARFCEMNGCDLSRSIDMSQRTGSLELPVNRWIVSLCYKSISEVTKALEGCAFDDASSQIYRFIWNSFCDWYLELAKPILNGANEAHQQEVREVASWVIEQSLRLLHPFMPFVTEELWRSMGRWESNQSMLIMADWPQSVTELESQFAQSSVSEIDWVIALITEIRSIRSQLNIPVSVKPELIMSDLTEQSRQWVERNKQGLSFLGRLSSISCSEFAPGGALPFVVADATGHLKLAQWIDIDVETKRITLELSQALAKITPLKSKLSNEDFISKAKPEVVEENKTRLHDAENAAAKLRLALDRLKLLDNR